MCLYIQGTMQGFGVEREVHKTQQLSTSSFKSRLTNKSVSSSCFLLSTTGKPRENVPHTGGPAQWSENEGRGATASHQRAVSPEGALTHRIRSAGAGQRPQRQGMEGRPPLVSPYWTPISSQATRAHHHWFVILSSFYWEMAKRMNLSHNWKKLKLCTAILVAVALLTKKYYMYVS